MLLRERSFCRMFLLFAALLQLTHCIELLDNCLPVDNVALFVSLGTNKTGHPEINARLEQPTNGENWKLETKLDFVECDTQEIPRKVITIKLTGSPPKFHEPQVEFISPYGVSSRNQQQRNQVNYVNIPTTAPTAAPTATPKVSTRLTLTSSRSLIPETQFSRYSQVEGLGYVRVERKPAEWKAARDACAAENASLAVPRDATAARTLASLFNWDLQGTYNKNMIWLGASDEAKEGHWVTTNNIPLNEASSVKWAPGEPTHKREENCLLFHKVKQQLADGRCSRIHPFACTIPF